MGCSAAKNVAVEPIGADQENLNGAANKDRNSTPSTSSNDTLPIEHDIKTEDLENAVVNNIQKAGSGMSFEITFDETDDKSESIIQKHPPKRILELQESEEVKAPITLDQLQEKLEEAEIRRQQILQQRVQSANLLNRIKNSEMLQSMESDTENTQSPHHLKVPTEKTPHPPNPYDVSYT